MHRHHFIISESLTTDVVTIVEPELVHQIFAVLKLKLGEQVVLSDGAGIEAIGEIATFTKHHVDIAIISRQKNATESERMVTLYCAVLKRDNFEWVVQKATEVGVKKIVPIITEHTVKLGLNHERLMKIAKEAAEQSGRGMIPMIEQPVPFKNAFEVAQGMKVFCDFSETQMTGEEIRKYGNKEIVLFIGPEGGWAEDERKYAEERGALVRALGKTVLRGETAAIVASFIAVNS